MTIASNSNSGQPVSMDKRRAASELAHRYKRPLIIAAAQYAEHCCFIKQRDTAYKEKSTIEFAREMFSYVDCCTINSKIDALINIDGFLAF